MAGLNLCGRENEKHIKAHAAANAKRRYQRSKNGQRFVIKSQMPAGRWKGMSHQRLKFSCKTQTRVQTETTRMNVPARPKIVKVSAVGQMACPFLRNSQKRNQRIPPP